MRVVVVGAGVVGLSCAYELSQRGAGVVVLDANEVGNGGSAGNAGWITPFLSSPRAAPGAIGDAARSLTRARGPARFRPHLDTGFWTWAAGFLGASRLARSRASTAALRRLGGQAQEHFDRLAQQGVQFELHDQGLGVVFRRRTNLETFAATAQQTRASGYDGDITVLRGRDVEEYDPAISRDVAGAVHLGGERHVRPESFTRGLADAIRSHGGRILERTPVKAVRREKSDAWCAIATVGEEYRCDHLVIAAGFPTRALVRPLGIRVPIEVAKGTSMTAAGEGTAPSHPLKLFEDMVACSPFDGAVRFSGTFDVGFRDRRVDAKRLKMVVTQGMAYLDSWRPTHVEMEWAGHRPTSADDLPIIGRVRGHPGLHLATGHGTLGVTLGPLTGSLVAREIIENDSSELLDAFRLERFRVKPARPAL